MRGHRGGTESYPCQDHSDGGAIRICAHTTRQQVRICADYSSLCCALINYCGDRLARLRLMIDTPALRARHLDSQFATQKAIVDALLGDAPDPEAEFRTWVAASTCLAAMHVALMRPRGRAPDLPGLIAAALGAAFDDDFD